MKVSTYKAFQKINARLDNIDARLAALVDEGSDRQAAKELRGKVAADTAKLKGAIPATAAASRRKS